MKTIFAQARVTVILDVELLQPWDESATIREIYQGAKEEATGRISSLINGQARIISATVMTVIAEKK